MDDLILQEVNDIFKKMIENKSKWGKRFVFVIIKLLFVSLLAGSYSFLIYFSGISIFSYIKIFGLNGDAILGIIAYTSLAFTILLANDPEPRIDFIMHHVENDTRILFIITTLQDEVTKSKLSIMSIDIVEHKCQTYLQIRYKKYLL
ncbi:MAG TPA: hypothetical protein DDW34_08780 [Clostridium sp.]|nr:hypothetical protein [Clostridium sp.]